jgi:hypothetical protein
MIVQSWYANCLGRASHVKCKYPNVRHLVFTKQDANEDGPVSKLICKVELILSQSGAMFGFSQFDKHLVPYKSPVNRLHVYHATCSQCYF